MHDAARDELLRRGGDENLAGLRHCHGARGHVDGDASQAVIRDLGFARVQPGAQRDADRGGTLDNGLRALDRPCQAVEGREEAVAGSLDLVSAEALQLLADDAMVLVQ